MNIESKVINYIKKSDKWEVGLFAIRDILLSTELEEDMRWGMPTYRINGKNVISICGFKNHFSIWFHNGSFLKDKFGILQNAQEGKTKGMRHLKYTKCDQVVQKVIKSYTLEAIKNQKEGKEIKPIRKSNALEIPDLLKSNLSIAGLAQLNALSISKRNEYILYITNAKRKETRSRRLEKVIPMIEKGEGLNDRYK